MGLIDNFIEKELKDVMEDEELKAKLNDYIEEIIQEQLRRLVKSPWVPPQNSPN